MRMDVNRNWITRGASLLVLGLVFGVSSAGNAEEIAGESSEQYMMIDENVEPTSFWESAGLPALGCCGKSHCDSCTSCNPCNSCCEPWTFHVMPQGFVYHTYWASHAEPRLATHLIDEAGQDSLLDSTIGGRVGLFRYGPKNSPEGWQLDVLGGAKLRQDPNEGLDVLATDYRYDILLTHGDGPHRYKYGFYHVSSHAGDEFLLKNPGFDRINFFRDVFVAGYSYYATPELRLYGEVGYGFNVEISEPWEVQFGLDYGPASATGISGAPFFAINAHLREELDFGGNLALQTGWAWRGEAPGSGVLRTGLFYYNGGSPQFSFYYENEQQLGWGLWYDF
ncbi:DUF1207 domain-containing protein [Planctomycetales bacterium 10988]|nr:DUF1207 domain-containing protein [Planctomycetales bacterium 10988]